VVAGLTAAVALSLVAGALVSSKFAVKAYQKAAEAERNAKVAGANAAEAIASELRENRKAKEAEQERDKAEERLDLINFGVANQKWLSAEVAETERHLSACPARFRNWEWGYLNRLCHLDLGTLSGHTGPVTSVYFSPDGKRLATVGKDGSVMIWDSSLPLKLGEEKASDTLDNKPPTHSG
jgi:hypothetical protein